tara:strand:+ start:2049 stop:2579 length:531 start_codon:yes stop_codon:yes gene_type:complete
MALKKLVTNSLNDDAVTAAKVENAINTTLEFVVPAGGIIMWSGSTGSIPSGWAICDGNNGTPDLRNRFVVGAGSTYSVNATGGSANAVLVAHSHSITDPGHDHTLEYTNTDSNDGRSSESGNGGLAGTHTTSNELTGITSTNVKGINAAGATANGQTGNNANLPPYLALAYIMKLS